MEGFIEEAVTVGVLINILVGIIRGQLRQIGHRGERIRVGEEAADYIGTIPLDVCVVRVLVEELITGGHRQTEGGQCENSLENRLLHIRV